MKKIAWVSISQIMGVEEVRIEPGKVTVIEGRNKAGKSSILNAIRAAFQANGLHVELVHLGAPEGKVVLKLDDGTLITRAYKPDGTTRLKVTDDEGDTKAKPQTLLDSLVGPGLCFNPVDFLTLKGSERRSLLLQAIPIKVSQGDLMDWFGQVFPEVDCERHGLEVLSEVYQILYDQRKEANAKGKSLTAQAASLQKQIPEGFDAEKWATTDVSSLSKTITDAGRLEAVKAAKKKEEEAAAYRAGELRMKAEGIRTKIEALQDQIADLVNEEEGLYDEAGQCDERANELEHEGNQIVVPDIEAAKRQLAEYSEAQAILKVLANLTEVTQQLVEAGEEAEGLDGAVKQAREKPSELLAQSALPIEGLEVTDCDIKVGGVSMDGLSTSEQVRVCLDIARALAGELRLIAVDNCEHLDSKTMAELERQMQQDEFQYVITRVSDGPLKISTGPQGDDGQLAIEVEDDV